MLPLLAFIKENNIRYKLPSASNIRNYFNIISAGYDNNSTYLPMLTLPNDIKEINRLYERLDRLVDYDIFGGECAFGYVVSELICNIYDHSEFSIGFIMGQKYNNLGFAELCVLDNGITIAGSLRKSGYIYNVTEHYKAINDALEGLSSKKEKGRGYGLNTSKKIFLDALGGELLIVSGYGALFMNKDNTLGINFNSDKMFNGTLISVRISNTPKSIDLYKYIE